MNTMPQNITGTLAAAWEALQARADVNGNVTVAATESLPELDLLAAVGGCTIGAPDADGNKVVTLNYADAPAEPAPAAEEVVAATKKTEFAGRNSANRR